MVRPGGDGEQRRVRRWIVAGHSLGGRVPRGSSTIAWRRWPARLIGTSHPRDFSGQQHRRHAHLRDTDTVADVESRRRRVQSAAVNALVRIDGGNHSQFGSYGFQPGDCPAQISRDEQQRITVQAICEALAAVK